MLSWVTTPLLTFKMFKRFKEIFPLMDTTGTFQTFKLESEQKEKLITDIQAG